MWQRQIQAWAVKDLSFTEPALGPVRVVMTEDRWPVARRVAGERVIWQIGHRRWGIENHVFNTLTQHYHLTHCPHHHPVAILAGLLILVLGFVVFGVFAQIHGKLLALGRTTLPEITEQLRRALEREQELKPLGSG